MEQQAGKNKMSICMGSSCFSRGNNENLKIIKNYVEEKGLSSQIELVGCLCQNECKTGPNLKINDDTFKNVEPITVVDILAHALKE